MKATATSGVVNIPKRSFGQRLARDFKKNWRLYLLFLPVLVYFIMFK